jgi:CelD/BcsL family acetyltransferase involved in cellulose biosynthesis
MPPQQAVHPVAKQPPQDARVLRGLARRVRSPGEPDGHVEQLAAASGGLRLGELKVDGAAAAARFWIVAGTTAHSVRNAHHEDYEKLAVGVVLTSHTIEHPLDRDRVERLGFGFGLEDYKSGWMRDLRNCCGFMAFNPGTARGLYQGVRHIGGSRARRAVVSVMGVLGIRRREEPTREAD